MIVWHTAARWCGARGGSDPARMYNCPDAPARAERRLLRRRHRAAEPARRVEEQPLAQAARRRHDVRQRRQLRPAARRARRAAAGRRAQVRAGAGAQRRAKRGACCSRACPRSSTPASRPHRRQPAAVDDGALQRRLPRRGRRPARAARLHGTRLAGQRSTAPPSARSTATARSRAAKSRWTPGSRRAISIKRVWLEPHAYDSPRRRRPRSPGSTRSSSAPAASTRASCRRCSCRACRRRSRRCAARSS